MSLLLLALFGTFVIKIFSSCYATIWVDLVLYFVLFRSGEFGYCIALVERKACIKCHHAYSPIFQQSCPWQSLASSDSLSWHRLVWQGCWQQRAVSHWQPQPSWRHCWPELPARASSLTSNSGRWLVSRCYGCCRWGVVRSTVLPGTLQSTRNAKLA